MSESVAAVRERASRLLIANLGFETELDGRALPDPVTRTIAALGTLLRVAAADNDRLWLPAAVDAARIATVEGLASPALEAGPIGNAATPPPVDILAWGETAATEKLRGRIPPAAVNRLSGAGGELWAAHSSFAVASELQHRARALEIARELDLALPDAAIVRDRDELDARLRAPPADSSARLCEGWVLKAMRSAAGRDRVIGSGATVRAQPFERAVDRLFERCGPLLLEPWLSRTADFGVAGVIDASGEVSIRSVHTQRVDGQGRIRAIEVTDDPLRAPGASPDDCERLVGAAARIGNRVARAGHRGPFGIDAWRYRSREREALHVFGELNVRWTFGLVARLVADAVAVRFGDSWRARLEFRSPTETNAEAIPLLRPSPDDRGAAWLEVTRGR